MDGSAAAEFFQSTPAPACVAACAAQLQAFCGAHAQIKTKIALVTSGGTVRSTRVACSASKC